MSATWEIRQGDALGRLREMPDESVQCCVTSPPYFGLRDYGAEGQIGLERTPDEFVAALVAVFAEVRRVLRSDGTLWLNIGDSYAMRAQGEGQIVGSHDGFTGRAGRPSPRRRMSGDLKNKDLIGIPWLLAFALRADGWYLRSDIIWAKPNPMPESVTDRPTSAHEHMFLLAKSARYFYDADAIREEGTDNGGGFQSRRERGETAPKWSERATGPQDRGGHSQWEKGEWGFGVNPAGRNKRSVWTVATRPYADAHFATFPPKLVEPCILAGSAERACGECGAPWERVTERRLDEVEAERIRSRPTRAKSKALENGDRNDGEFQGLSGQEFNRLYRVETTGYEPSCEHDDDTGRSVILDPFAGAGTTGVVALRRGRSFIGIELNPAYCALARDRIRDDAPLLNTHAEVAA